MDLKRDVALIPRVAIHLNRETNNGVKYDPARDLVALYAAGTGSGSFYREVARTADCAPEDVVAGGSGAVQQPAGGPSGDRRASSCRPPGWTIWPVCLPAPRAF